MFQCKGINKISLLAATSASLLSSEISKAELSNQNYTVKAIRVSSDDYYKLLRSKNLPDIYRSKLNQPLLLEQSPTNSNFKTEKIKSDLDPKDINFGKFTLGIFAFLGVGISALALRPGKLIQQVNKLIDSQVSMLAPEREFLNEVLNRSASLTKKFTGSLDVLSYLAITRDMEEAQWINFKHKLSCCMVSACGGFGVLGAGYMSGSKSIALTSFYIGIGLAISAVYKIFKLANDLDFKDRGQKVLKEYKEWKKQREL